MISLPRPWWRPKQSWSLKRSTTRFLEIPGKVEQVAASHADARRLWEGWKLQPTCLPVLEPFERHRVLHDCGITLVAYESGADDYVTTV